MKTSYKLKTVGFFTKNLFPQYKIFIYAMHVLLQLRQFWDTFWDKF